MHADVRRDDAGGVRGFSSGPNHIMIPRFDLSSFLLGLLIGILTGAALYLWYEVLNGMVLINR